MRPLALCALALGLAAGQSADEVELLQAQGVGVGEDDVALESSLLDLVHSVIFDEQGETVPAGPATETLIKLLTKTGEDGKESLELKPLVTTFMDMGRQFTKHSMEMVSPKLLAASRQAADASMEMLTATEEIISEVLLKDPLAAKVIDNAIAMNLQDFAQVMSERCAKNLQRISKATDGASTLMTFAKVGLNQAGQQAAAKKMDAALESIRATRVALTKAMDGAKSSLDFIAKSDLALEESKDKALTMKRASIWETTDRLAEYEWTVGREQKKMLAGYKELLATMVDVVPQGPWTVQAKALSSVFVQSVGEFFEDGFKDVMAALLDELNTQAQSVM